MQRVAGRLRHSGGFSARIEKNVDVRQSAKPYCCGGTWSVYEHGRLDQYQETGFSGGVSKRQILRETKMHWKTLEKILAHDSPPGYRRSEAPIKRKIGPYLDRVSQIIEADKQMPKKQRHTAKRIWQRLREEFFVKWLFLRWHCRIRMRFL